MKSIRSRLVVMLLTGLMAVLAVGGAAVYLTEKTSLTRQFDEGLAARVHTLVSLVKLEPQGLIFESGDAPAATLGETFFELRTRSGKVLKRSKNLGKMILPEREPLENQFAFENADLPGSIPGRLTWFAFRPRVDLDDWSGLDVRRANPELMIVAAGLDRRSIDLALATLLTTLSVVGGAVAVAAGVLVTLGVNWGLAPLSVLSRQLGSVTGNTISKRFDDGGAPMELAPIYRELNGMLDRVEFSIERERAFADATAHELRTPLAELRTVAEVAVRWPDAHRLSSSLSETMSIGREMEHLVESLLLISRGNAKELNGTIVEVSLPSIVQRCLDPVLEKAGLKRLCIDVDLDAIATLPAQPAALEIIVRNLIGNAVQYTAAGGSIGIRTLHDQNGSSSLLVENGPVELKPSDLPRLFEPFWRKDSARTDREHVGLGLTVVQRIADATGLQLHAVLDGDRLQIQVLRANSERNAAWPK